MPVAGSSCGRDAQPFLQADLPTAGRLSQTLGPSLHAKQHEFRIPPRSAAKDDSLPSGQYADSRGLGQSGLGLAPFARTV